MSWHQINYEVTYTLVHFLLMAHVWYSLVGDFFPRDFQEPNLVESPSCYDYDILVCDFRTSWQQQQKEVFGHCFYLEVTFSFITKSCGYVLTTRKTQKCSRAHRICNKANCATGYLNVMEPNVWRDGTLNWTWQWMELNLVCNEADRQIRNDT